MDPSWIICEMWWKLWICHTSPDLYASVNLGSVLFTFVSGMV